MASRDGRVLGRKSIRKSSVFLALAAITLLVGGSACTRSEEGPEPPPKVQRDTPTTPRPSETHKRDAPPAPQARLEHPSPCPNASGFTCAVLRVPLDHARPKGETLELPVAAAAGGAKRPVLLLLTGGPGQGGVSFLPTAQRDLAPVLDDYRLVMLDQRGTGQNAITCPALQEAVGGSDLLTAPPSAVRQCAQAIGSERRFYTTADTVADLDLLRRALGVEKWTLDGVSYGSFVAQQYAIERPSHVRALVLDSVVPHDDFDTFLRTNLRRAAYALRDACRDCPNDPARDLAWVVRNRGDGVEILNALTLLSVFDPTFREIADVPEVLHLARRGDRSGLEDVIAQSHEWGAFDASELSAGLHAATLCTDLRFPWGDSGTPLQDRRSALRRAAARIPARAVWPFDVRTATGHGVIQSCLHWPPVSAPELPEGPLPDVPVLLLNGERDLSTPVAWAKAAAAEWPNSRLVVTPDDGHSVHVGDPLERAQQAVSRFLLKER